MAFISIKYGSRVCGTPSYPPQSPCWYFIKFWSHAPLQTIPSYFVVCRSGKQIALCYCVTNKGQRRSARCGRQVWILKCGFWSWWLLVVGSFLPMPRWMQLLKRWVDIGSGNGLVLDSTKPLPEPILTKITDVYDHQVTRKINEPVVDIHA